MINSNSYFSLNNKDSYLMATKTSQYPATFDRSENGLEPVYRKCILKYGEGDDVYKRVDTLDGTFVYEKPIIKHHWKNPPLTDKQVHKELEKRGIKRYREDRQREFFEFDSVEQAIRIINDILYGTKKLKTYPPREEQIEMVENICGYWESNKSKRALMNAKMRFGKCYVSYKIVNKMNFKRILILTYKPNGVSESWEDDIDHIEFKDFTFKKSIELSEVKFDESENNQVIFSSFQDVIGETKDINGNLIKEHKDKFDILINQHFDLVIIDEVHYGYETEKSNKFLSKLNYDYELSLSGTPFKAILDGKYNKDEIFTWTYLDEQIKRKVEKETNWKTDTYRPLPEFEVYTCSYDNNIINKFLKYYKEEDRVTNFKLFSIEKLTYDFLDWIKIDPSMNNLITNHMFWYLPQIINCDTIENVISKHPYWKDYKIINASGDKVKDLNDTKNKIYNSYSKTITLSCGRWNTGTTVKQWSSVWMLDDGYSAENWFQTGMRSGSPWMNDGDFLKEKVNIVDFNSDRMLKCYIEYSTIISKYTNYEPSEYASEMLKCMPIFSVNGSSVYKIETNDLFEHFNKFLSDSFGSLSMLDRTKMDDDIKEILKDINGNITKEDKFILNSSNKKGKNTIKSLIKEGKVEIEKLEDYIIKARVITNRIKNFLFVVDRVNNVDDITNYKHEFKTQTGIGFDKFKVLLDSGFISTEKINDSIDLFNINNEYLYK